MCTACIPYAQPTYCLCGCLCCAGRAGLLQVQVVEVEPEDTEAADWDKGDDEFADASAEEEELEYGPGYYLDDGGSQGSWEEE